VGVDAILDASDSLNLLEKAGFIAIGNKGSGNEEGSANSPSALTPARCHDFFAHEDFLLLGFFSGLALSSADFALLALVGETSALVLGTFHLLSWLAFQTLVQLWAWSLHAFDGFASTFVFSHQSFVTRRTVW